MPRETELVVESVVKDFADSRIDENPLDCADDF